VIPSEPRPMNTGLEARLARASELPVFLGAFAALAAVFTTWIAWRISVPLEINVNEPWNAWHASNALAPDRLYPGRNALIVNNYPPLSFIVLRLVSPLFTNAIVAGRVLSILSVLLVGAATYRCARELGVGRTTFTSMRSRSCTRLPSMPTSRRTRARTGSTSGGPVHQAN